MAAIDSRLLPRVGNDSITFIMIFLEIREHFFLKRAGPSSQNARVRDAANVGVLQIYLHRVTTPGLASQFFFSRVAIFFWSLTVARCLRRELAG